MQKDVIPDFIVIEDGYYPDHSIRVIVEAKSENVIKEGPKKVSPQDQRASVMSDVNNVFSVLQPVQDHFPEDHAVHFRWPENTSNVNAQTRLLIQVRGLVSLSICLKSYKPCSVRFGGR